MNKQIINVFTAAGLLFAAGIACAAPAAFQGNTEVGPAANTPDIVCPLMAETVTLGVSAKVHGALDCAEVTNIVEVAACHEGGSREQGVACTDQDITTAGDQLPPGCAALGGNSTIPSYKAFFTSSKGGVLAENPLGSRCSAATITGASGFALQ